MKDVQANYVAIPQCTTRSAHASPNLELGDLNLVSLKTHVFRVDTFMPGKRVKNLCRNEQSARPAASSLNTSDDDRLVQFLFT